MQRMPWQIEREDAADPWDVLDRQRTHVRLDALPRDGKPKCCLPLKTDPVRAAVSIES